MRTKIISNSDTYKDTGRTVDAETYTFLTGGNDVGERKVYASPYAIEMDGITIQKDARFIFLNKSDVIFYCLNDQPIGSGVVPAGSLLWFHDGQLVSSIFNADTSFTDINFKKGSALYFYLGKQISSGVLAKDTNVQGFMLKENTTVNLYENGQLCEGRLAVSTTLNGAFFIKGTLVVLDNSVLEHVELEEDVLAKSYLFRKNSTLHFHPNGQVSVGMLAREEEIRGISFSKLSDLFFDDKGNIIKAEVEEFVFRHESKEYPLFLKDAEINGVTIKLSPKESWLITKTAFSYKGVTYPAGSVLYFDGNNHAESILVKEPISINRKSYPANTHFWFRPGGTPYVPK